VPDPKPVAHVHTYIFTIAESHEHTHSFTHSHDLYSTALPGTVPASHYHAVSVARTKPKPVA
jgi:hypothetical protein